MKCPQCGVTLIEGANHPFANCNRKPGDPHTVCDLEGRPTSDIKCHFTWRVSVRGYFNDPDAGIEFDQSWWLNAEQLKGELLKLRALVKDGTTIVANRNRFRETVKV